MTERTLLKQTRAEFEDDAISLTSSQSEQYSSDQEFLVERILAEKKGADGKMYFLVFWAHYPEEKATWEPKKNIQDPEILQVWKERKDQESRGLKPTFNLARFDARIQELARAKADRRRRRKIKRKQLGIPVSPDPVSPRRADDSDSTEAVESDEAPEDDPGIKKKSKAPQKSKKPSKQPFLQLDSSDDEAPPTRRQTSIQRDEYESDGTGTSDDSLIGDLQRKADKKKAKKKTLQAIRDKRATQGPTKVPTSQDTSASKKPPGNSASTRPRSSSSSEVPLAEVAEQRRQSQQRSESTDTATSKQLANTRKASLKLPPKTISSTASLSTRGRSAGRGSSAVGRGRGATRGGSSLTPRNVFSSRVPPKKRPTLIENATDASKDPKHFTNMHLRRKAQLAGRERADAAPDISALGGLYNPSDPSTFQSLKPVALRKAPVPALGPPNSVFDLSTEIDDLFVSQSPPITSASVDAWDPTPDINPPLQHNSPPQTAARAQWQERHGYNAICHFWHTKGDCSKGYQCSYKHTNDDHLPIGPPPPGHHSHYISLSHATPQEHSPTTPVHPSSKSPWDRPESWPEHLKAVCFFWHTRRTCTKGDNCGYFHTYEGNLPIAPDPNQGDRSPIPSPARQYSPPGPAPPPSRPPWDRWNPVNAICHYYHTRGSCKKGNNCKYLHTDDINIPVAPAPNFQNETCKYWARGHCEKSDGLCQFLHGYPEPPGTTPEYSESRRQQSPNIRDGAVTIPTGPRKSVSFAIDEPMIYSDEPENYSPTKPVPTQTSSVNPFRDPKYNRRCTFWARGICNRGSECRYWHSNDGSDKEIQPVIENLRRDIRENRTSELSAALPLGGHQTEPDASTMADTSSPVADKAETSPPKPKRAKISMDNYRRNQAIKALGDRAKEVAFGKDETKFVFVDFGDLTQTKQQPWGESFAALAKLHFTQICLAQDFKGQLGSLINQTLWQGSLSPEPTDQDALQTMNKAWEHLRLSSAGFVSVCTDFIVLMYPAIEEWKFIEGNASFSPEMRLRYLIFQSNLDFSPPPDTGLAGRPADYRKNLVEAIHGLNFKLLVPKIKKDQTYHFYLLFPSTANKTAEFVSNWLRASCNQIKIYSSQTEGAWDFFVKDSSVDIGSVLIHESSVVSVCELPSLRALFANNKAINFWYIAEGAAEYPIYGPPEGSSPGQITATRLLPHGHAFFLTPSFLIAEPDRAFYVIRWFLKDKSKKSTPGTWKLVCAHNIRDYLLDIAIEKSAEKDELEIKHQGDPRKDAIMEEKGLGYATCKLRFQMHELVVELLSQQVSENYSDYDSDTPDESVSPIIYASEFIDADDEQALVTWFAGWAMCKLDQFRKFTVIGSSTKYEKRAVRRKEVISRAGSPKLGEPLRTGLPTCKEPSKPGLFTTEEQSNPGSHKSSRRFRDHPALSSADASNIASTSVKSLDRRASIAESPVNAGKVLALAIAAKLNSSAPTTPLSASKTQEKNPFDTRVLPSISESSPTTTLPEKPQLPRGESVGTLGGHTFIRPQGEVVGSLPQQTSPNSPPASSDIEMSIETNPISDREPATTKHGIDPQAPPEALQFIMMTGSNLETAKFYLSKSNNNLQLALNSYTAEVGAISQLDGVDDSMDIDEQVSRAIKLYGTRPTTGSFSPQVNNDSVFSPPRFDGPGDERPRSSGANSVSSSRSGIQIDDNGRRVVPASVRLSGTVRPELAIKPGYIPIEDREVYRNPHRRIVDGEVSNGSSRNVSHQGSPAVEESTSGEMEKREVVMKEIKYEATTTWYIRWYKEGRGWEHIYVESSEKAFKYLGVK